MMINKLDMFHTNKLDMFHTNKSDMFHTNKLDMFHRKKSCDCKQLQHGNPALNLYLSCIDHLKGALLIRKPRSKTMNSQEEVFLSLTNNCFLFICAK